MVHANPHRRVDLTEIKTKAMLQIVVQLLFER